MVDKIEVEVEVPQYFLCPISLQIMKDPVTTATGITYDRRYIEQWLKTAADSVCPVTKQPLTRDSDDGLTPNHTLRRLIQAWCVANARHGVDRIPTPKAPLSRAHILKILRGVTVPRLQSTSLDQLLSLATSDDHIKDRKTLIDSGVSQALLSFMIKCHKENKTSSSCLQQSLKVLIAIWTPTSEVKAFVDDNNYVIINALTWVINGNLNDELQTLGVLLTKEVVKVTSSNIIEKLTPDFYKSLVRILRNNKEGVKAAIQVLLEVCQHGRNRYRIVEACAIFELIELQLGLEVALTAQQAERKKLTELVFCLLAQLCSCADGRAQFLAHAGAIAVVAKRIMRVSPTVDDRAVHILALMCKFSATNETLQEMLRVGAVSKLCMVLQADCAKYLKEKTREILRMHSYIWNNSPCIQVYLLTRYPMIQF